MYLLSEVSRLFEMSIYPGNEGKSDDEETESEEVEDQKRTPNVF